MKDYDLIEHTADIGIRVNGKDLKEIFINVASAMFDVIAELRTDCTKLKLKDINIKIQADDRDELLVEWLNELLSLSETKELIFDKFKIVNLTDKYLEAVVSGYPRENFRIQTEIKAATYHELKIKKLNSSWQVELIFDI
jgi:SHS2 domain-containing protein